MASLLPTDVSACLPETLGQPTKASPDAENEQLGHIKPHTDAKEIIRQVEFYFSDENLPGDAHLLSQTGGDGNGPVLISHILSFNKMRKYKPVTSVIASLRQSTKLEVVESKFIRRREPLTLPLLVTPKINGIGNSNAEKLKKAPWLTKGMLKPTGFETHNTDGPITPSQHAQERELYDPEDEFHIRIEIAVARFAASKKWHQLPAKIFARFLILGGFDAGPRQFTGAICEQDLMEEECSKDEIAQMTSIYAVSPTVLEGLADKSKPDRAPTWVVDFEGLAKAFLYSHFVFDFSWYDRVTVETACTVLGRFYDYLLLHDVCNEYRGQIEAARRVCSEAGPELLRLGAIDRALPGSFNRACSQLHTGSYGAFCEDDNTAKDRVGRNGYESHGQTDAFVIFATAIMAHGSPEQISAFERAAAARTKIGTCWHEDVGMEVVKIEHLDELPEAKEVYANDKLQGTVIKPTGKLHCKLWTLPQDPPDDLSPDVIAATRAKIEDKLTFLVDEDVLDLCSIGMKLEAEIYELDIGIKWMDTVKSVYPRSFVWVENDRMRDYKEPGEPMAWMKRVTAKRTMTDEVACPEKAAST